MIGQELGNENRDSNLSEQKLVLQSAEQSASEAKKIMRSFFAQR